MTVKKQTLKEAQVQLDTLQREGETLRMRLRMETNIHERALADFRAKAARDTDRLQQKLITAGLVPIELLADVEIVTNKDGTTAEVTITDQRVIRALRPVAGGGFTGLGGSLGLFGDFAKAGIVHSGSFAAPQSLSFLETPLIKRGVKL